MSAPTSKGWAERFYNDHWGRNEFRRAVTQRMVPILRAFRPDLIIVSAGFDAANHDLGNSRILTNTMVGFDLECEDYYWVATQLARVADVCCNSRLVAVLEGGYGEHQVSSATLLTRSKSPEFDGVVEVGRGRIDREPLARNVSSFIEGLVGLPLSAEASSNSRGAATEDEVCLIFLRFLASFFLKK